MAYVQLLPRYMPHIRYLSHPGDVIWSQNSFDTAIYIITLNFLFAFASNVDEKQR